MTHVVRRAFALPARTALLDLTGRGATVVAGVAMALVSAIDLIDGRLGPILSAGFVMVAVMVALSVHERYFWTAAVTPPLLLLATFLGIALIAPQSIQLAGLAPDVHWAGRAISGVVDRGVTLIVGYGLVLALIALRVASRRG